jgi:hypothetical protein
MYNICILFLLTDSVTAGLQVKWRQQQLIRELQRLCIMYVKVVTAQMALQ